MLFLFSLLHKKKKFREFAGRPGYRKGFRLRVGRGAAHLSRLFLPLAEAGDPEASMD